jgi:hypothetical protein
MPNPPRWHSNCPRGGGSLARAFQKRLLFEAERHGWTSDDLRAKARGDKDTLNGINNH